MTQNEIWETINSHIEKYYNEYTPILYERTYTFAKKLIKTEIVKNGNSLSCKVGIDPDYLSFGYKETMGADVVNWANNHSHGGIYNSNFGCFWDDAMQELGLEKGILDIMRRNLRECGVSVK